MKSRTLDLGSGRHPKNPFNADEVVGIDIVESPSSNVLAVDLSISDIPFQDNYFDFCSAFDFLEHVPRLVYAPSRRFSFVQLMNEVYRVLKPGGLFVAFTPCYPSQFAFSDPTHTNFLTIETMPNYFSGTNPSARMYGLREILNC
jgi:SAM-dependent methyltransferase